MSGRLGVLILAAGKGVRMHGAGSKVMRHMLGEPMLYYVLEALSPLSPGRLWTVVGHGAEEVRSFFADSPTQFVFQEKQLGTGHALAAAWPVLRAAEISHVLVVNGDTPLITTEAMRSFTERSMREDMDLALMALCLEDPGAFGRVIRDSTGKVTAVAEAKDFDVTVHGPFSGEVNAGIYCLRLDAVNALLPRLGNDNKSREFYITDLVELAVADGLRVLGVQADGDCGFLGINTPAELMEAEEMLRSRIAAAVLRSGVCLRGNQSVRIGPKALLEPGAEVTGPCEIYGESRVASGARVESHCVLIDSTVASGALVRSFCHLEGAEIGPDCVVGPFARIRPGTVLDEKVHAGSFVEIKKSRLRSGAKANHLAYIGDADIGSVANMGAGVITCNYDGKHKHSTRVGTGAFVGSNVSLVAPVEVADGSFVGAGSVITEDVPPGMLALGRGRQVNLIRKGRDS
jgi:bifunctional UDP-N-acetylglucosamine pyrophosphorylase/glucosamine-1-phosphate N-acetyltransferase